MKLKTKLALLLVFGAFALQGMAQNPEPVYSIVRQVHDFDWYEQQAKAWKQEIDKGTTNKMAWVYWFEANRMAANFCDYKKWKSKQGEYFLPLKKIKELAETTIPNSFEFYFIKLFDNDAGASSASSAEYTMKAQALRPFDPLLLPFLTNYYLFKNDKANFELTCKKWYDSNEIPQELLITAYNNLVSLEPNAILFTNGDNDTYPTWVLQYAQKVRPDVLVLNVPLTTYKDELRENIFKENGIEPLTFKNDSSRTSSAVFKHVVRTVTNRPIYISIYSGEDCFKGMENKMYITGLSFKYSAKPFDNIAVLRNNIENKFMLDFLKRTFYNNPSRSICLMMNGGYIAGFVKLLDYYKRSGETEKAKKIKELAMKVANDSGNAEWIKYFDR